jgi:hypothetical protein
VPDSDWTQAAKITGRHYAAQILTSFVDEEERGEDAAFSRRLTEEAAANAPVAAIAGMTTFAATFLDILYLDLGATSRRELLAPMLEELAKREAEEGS